MSKDRAPWWKKWWGKMGIWTAIGTVIVEALWHWLIEKSVFKILWRELVQFCNWLAQEVSIPLWLLIVITFSGLSVIGTLAFTGRRLWRAEARIEQLLNPPIEMLDDEEHLMIMAIAGHLDNKYFPTEDDLETYLNLSSSKVRLTVAHLTKRKLVEEGRLEDHSTFVDLTYAGLEYTTRPESYARSKQMAFVDGGRAEIAE